MKIFLRAILLFVFVVANYYAIHFSFLGLTYKSDVAFLWGLLGIILLVVSDGLIVVHVLKPWLPKEDSK